MSGQARPGEARPFSWLQRVSLRAKLALALALAAAVPLVVIEQLNARSVRQAFARSTDAQFESLRRLVESQIAREGARVSRRVEQAAQDYALRDAILALAGDPAGGARALVIRRLAEAADRLGLRLLTLVGDDGQVVASAEEPARFDVEDLPLADLARRHAGREVFLAYTSGLEVRGLALRAAGEVAGGGSRYWLVGGTLVEPDLLEEMGVAEPMALLLVNGDAITAAPTEGGKSALAALSALPSTGSIRLPDVEQQLTAQGFRVARARLGGVWQDGLTPFLFATSQAPLEAALAEMARSSMLLLFAGLLLAWLLAYALARRWTDPIAALVAGFERVAEGDLEVRLDISRGDELGRLVDSFHAMTHDLSESRAQLLQSERIAAWREIARQLAHEIKNPLSPIAMSMETLRRAYVGGRADFPALLNDCTATVLEEVERLRRIVQEFSDFARLPRPRLVDGSFHEVVRGVVSLHAGSAVHFDLDLEPGEGRFLFDPDQMNRLLVNLVKNAIEAMKEGGRVGIRTRTDYERGRFVVVVRDAGPGVPIEIANRLFEPYMTSKPGGTGLGLAIVRRIAEEHGGTTVLENPGEAGARFRVEFSLTAP